MKSFVVRYLGVLGIVSLATLLMMARFDFPWTGIDDANIFFVYARNFADGHGFVYNVGGERIEGFSSLLWTLVCTVVFYVSSQPALTLLILNVMIVSLTATVALSYLQSTFFGKQDNRHLRFALSLLFLVFLFTSPAYLVWNTIVLMENALWGTLLLLATILVIGENVSSKPAHYAFIFLSILLLLTRPEAFLWVSVFTAILLIRKILANGISRGLREIVPVLASIVTSFILVTIFRLVYFGYPLPNTYYAKVSPSFTYNFLEGILYFAEYWVSNPIVSICVLAAMLAGVHTILRIVERKFTNDGLLFLPVVAIVGLLVPTITGGDHFSFFRFYQAMYPILLLCLFYFVGIVSPRYIHLVLPSQAPRQSRMAFVSSLVLLLVASFVLYQARDWISSEETSQMKEEFAIAKRGREEGRFIHEMFTTLPELPSIGVIRAGGIKYTYPGEVIDLMGINNLTMAHNGGSRVGEKNHAAFEKPTFYQLQPDLLSAKIVSNEDWIYKEIELRKSWDNTVPLKGLYDDAAFLERYRYAKIFMTRTAERALVAWFRDDFLHDLERGGAFVIERYEYGNE